MSTHIVGFKAPDEKWKAMKAIWDACENAGIDVPGEVEKYFGGEPPDERGVEVDLDEDALEWSDDSCSGYEIDVKKIPKDVTHIRFYNAW